MIVDRDNRIGVFLYQRTHQVIGTLLHFRIGTLNSIQLDTVAVTACIYRRHRAAAQTDTIVVAADHYHLVAFLRLLLQTVAFFSVTHATCKHNHFVVGIFGRLVVWSFGRLVVWGFLMFEGEYRTADEWLTKLISEVAGTIGSLDQNLLWCLIQPFANRQNIFPISFFYPRIRRHIDSGTCNRPGADTAAHTVANLAARTCSSTIKRLYRRWEVMGFGLQRDDTLNILHLEIIAGALVCWRELLHNRTLCECHIIFIGRENHAWILGSCLLDHRKQRAFHLLAVDDKGATENLMAAVLRIDLCKTEYLGIGQRTAVLFLNLMQVVNFLWRKGQTLFLIELLQVFHLLDGSRLDVDREDILIQTVVHALQHRIVVGFL